jgi:hypothetical protein
MARRGLNLLHSLPYRIVWKFEASLTVAELPRWSDFALLLVSLPYAGEVSPV